MTESFDTGEKSRVRLERVSVNHVEPGPDRDARFTLDVPAGTLVIDSRLNVRYRLGENRIFVGDVEHVTTSTINEVIESDLAMVLDGGKIVEGKSGGSCE